MGGEAKEVNGEIHLNGYFKATLIGFASFMIMVQLTIVGYMVSNDRKYIEMITENKVSIGIMTSTLKSMDKNLGEINAVLKRTAPYERVRVGSH